MYRDLDPSTWPDSSQITDRALVRGLLQDGFQSRGSMVPEDANIDPFILPSDKLHIFDSDSRQAPATHEVRRGRAARRRVVWRQSVSVRVDTRGRRNLIK